jgi:hypothetical protein
MRLAVFAVASLSLLAACGASPCTRFKAAEDHVFPNGDTCTYTSTGTGGSSTVSVYKSTTDTASCETGYPKCSSADQTIITDYIACLEKVPPCTTGNEKASDDAQTVCLGKLFNSDLSPKISQECANAFK